MNWKNLLSKFENYQPLVDTVVSLGYLFGAIVAGILLNAVFFRFFSKYVNKTPTPFDNLFPTYGKSPARLILVFLFIQIISPYLRFNESSEAVFKHSLNLLFIASITYLLVNMTHMFRSYLMMRYDWNHHDNLAARKIITQVKVLQNVILVIIFTLSIALMLMTFESIRQIGTSILASAGIAGIIIGFAAQKSLANLLAGIQIALTQPIRLDDVVIVEGEWGRIEEITLTYVVVRIWDLRRLIVPIHYFLEKPFQNWTRVSADILGTIFLYTDYTVSVQAIRDELEKQVRDQPKWDGKVCVTQVTNTTQESLEIRLLVSSSNASDAWELRCNLRESMLNFLQHTYPESLPRLRAEVVPNQKSEVNKSANINSNGNGGNGKD